MASVQPVRALHTPIEVAVKRLSVNRMKVEGSVVVDQPVDRVWQVLTDYDHLAQFIPWLLESRTLAVGPPRLLRQRGHMRWWVFGQTIEMTFQVTEHPKQVIAFTAVEGDFFEHQGTWRLEPHGTQVRIAYEAVVRPKFFLPPFIGASLLKRHLADSLQAIVERVDAAKAAMASTRPWHTRVRKARSSVSMASVG